MSSERNIKCRSGRGKTRDAERNLEIDLALAVMCAIQAPGQRVGHRVIADITGMSHDGPYAIEQAALKKLRNRLLYGSSESRRVLEELR